MEFLRIYEEEMFNQTRIFPGVEDFLTQHKGPMAVVTNKNEVPAKAIIKHLGLDQFPWRQVYGADSLAEQSPDPLAFENRSWSWQAMVVHNTL